MRIPLGLLAFGTLTTWLVAGPFGHYFAETLPLHKVHALTFGEMNHEVWAAPLTWGALVIIALGLLAWSGRKRLFFITDRLGWLATAASKSFGFERINQQVAAVTQLTANRLRGTQPGHMSWNLVGILGGLVVVLIVLTWGA